MKKMTFLPSISESMIKEIISEVKTVVCTPKEWYYNDPEEEATEVGDSVAVFDRHDVHRCTIEITANYEIPFGDVDERIAKGENMSLDDYIETHTIEWKEPFQQDGFKFNNETIIVVEHFKLVKVIKED